MHAGNTVIGGRRIGKRSTDLTRFCNEISYCSTIPSFRSRQSHIMPIVKVKDDLKKGKASEYHIHSPWESVTSLFSSSSSSSTETKVRTWTSSITNDPILVGVISAVVATGLTVGGIQGYRRYWRRIRNADYVTSGMLDRKKWVKGIVTRLAAVPLSVFVGVS